MVGEKEVANIAEQFSKAGALGKEAAAGTSLFSESLGALFRVAGFGYAGGHLTTILNQLGLASKDLKRLGPIVFETSKQFQDFTRGLGYAVGGMSAFLDQVDKLERKQSELNRAYGIGSISISDYYKQLVEATSMGGKAARASAEDIIKTMREQREGTEKEINEMIPLFIKYSLGISKAFPRDFIFMHEQLGMGLDEIGDSYETIALNAAAARMPLDLYKNTIFSLTGELHQYGFSTRAAMRLTNLFMDDIKRGTLTMREAQTATRVLTQMQLTAGGFGGRARMAMFLRRATAAGDMPEGLQRMMGAATEAQYGPGARFAELNAMQMQYVLHRLDPAVFARVFRVAAKESMRDIPEEARSQVFPQLWGGLEYRFWEEKLGKALRGGSEVFVDSVEAATEGMIPVAKETLEAIKALRKQIEENTKNMREWYYPLSQLLDWLRSKGWGGTGGVVGGAIGAAPGALMTALALRGAGFAGGISGTGGAGGIVMGFAKMLGPMAVFTAGLIAAGLAFKALQEGIKWWEEKHHQKQMLLEIAESPGSRGYVLSQMILAEEAYRTGKGGIAREALAEVRMYRPWKEMPSAHVLPGLVGIEYEAYRKEMLGREREPISLEAFRSSALAGMGAGAPILIVRVDKGVVVEEVDNALSKLRAPGGGPVQIYKE